MKTILFLVFMTTILFITGCSSIDKEYSTVFKEDFKTMEANTPFQESTKKYLGMIYDNNQTFKKNLDIYSYDLHEFENAEEFKNLEKLNSFKETTQNQKQYFDEYFTKHFSILDEWEIEIKALEEGGNSQFTEDFYKKFKKDLNKHNDEMAYVKNLGVESFDLQINFIDFIVDNNANLFVPEEDLVFYDSNKADECFSELLKTVEMKEDFYNKFDEQQDLWIKNLRISNAFGKYNEYEMKCYPASGLTAEENYKRTSQIELDAQAQLSMKKAELHRMSR